MTKVIERKGWATTINTGEGDVIEGVEMTKQDAQKRAERGLFNKKIIPCRIITGKK